ncbi:MAG TPA: hypothetical protein VK680_01535 [Solirubrobacteraceae bacterium]|nr:hypothetical protein [Solirubrobacteraceae bacterium]
MVPALAGLSATWWRRDAHGLIAGLHPAVRPAHVVRGDRRVGERLVTAVAAATAAERIRVDGGLTNDATLLTARRL